MNPHTCIGKRKKHLLGTLALSCLMVAGLQAQSTPTASTTSSSDTDDDTVTMPTMEITGSRIKRLDAEAVSPVIEIKQADLAKIGFPSLGDAIRSMPFNNGQALTPTDSGTSFTPGVSTINLRGLGNNQTLVLINGRRAVPYASPGFDGLQTMFDFNSVPASAIESIEILKDGGSAIYGSDAVGGVVNIKLRHDFNGVAGSMEFGDYYNTGGLLKKGSITAGMANARTSILGTFSWSEQAAVFARDVAWTKDADKTSVAHKANGRYTAEGWAAAGYDSEQAYLEDIGATDAIADGWFDNRSSRGFPGYLTVPGVGRRTFDAPTDNPTTAGSVAGYNLYNYQETNGLFPPYRSYSFYTQMRHEFSDSLYGFAELSFNRYETQVYSAATPVDIETEHGLGAADSMVYPGEIPYDYAEGEEPFMNPFNPWGVDVSNGRRRLVELPNRINDVTSDTPRVLVGVGGDLSATGMEGWSWEAGLLYNKNTVNNIATNGADARLQEAFYGLTRLGDGSLAWDPTTPPAERVYFNWFGMNEPAFADFINVENPTSDYLTYWQWDASLNGRLFDLPAGPVNMAAGVEHRSEDFGHVQTDLNATGGLLGGGTGTSSFGKRSVTSLYGEIDVPIVKQLEAQFAARYEDYSDKGFQDKARPKVGLKFRPVDWLILRGSLSQSFKAPDLAYLFTTSSTSFTSGQYPDPVNIDPDTGLPMVIDQIQIVTAGNPNLKPEITDTWFAGAVFEAPSNSRLKGLELSIDYFSFKQKDLLAQLSDYYTYAEFLTRAADGDPLFAGKVVRDSNNQLLYIRDDYANISKAHYQGYDFSAKYRLETENLGTFTAGWDATYLHSQKINGDELAGTYLTPKWNAVASLSWTKGDWSTNLYGIYRGHRSGVFTYGPVFGEGDILYVAWDCKSQTTVNASVTYSGFHNTAITVGATNVLNTTPPVDPWNQNGLTPGVNDPSPGFWYVRIERNF